jgi:hypothetical protein
MGLRVDMNEPNFEPIILIYFKVLRLLYLPKRAPLLKQNGFYKRVNILGFKNNQTYLGFEY